LTNGTNWDANGALGGKLVGAGGGGFLMFYAKDRRAAPGHGWRRRLEEVRFRFDFEGTRSCSDESARSDSGGGLATRLRPLTEHIPNHW
jgi:mevalonate kinase